MNMCMLKTQAGSIKQDTWYLLKKPDCDAVFFIEVPFILNPSLEYSKSKPDFNACQLRKSVLQNSGNPESIFINKIHKILINN